MPAHHVGILVVETTRGVVHVRARGGTSCTLLFDKTVHLAAVNVGGRVFFAVRSAIVLVVRIVERLDALFRLWIKHTNGWHAVLHWDTVRTGIGTKVVIERTILLHDDDDVFDFVAQEAQLIRRCGRAG